MGNIYYSHTTLQRRSKEYGTDILIDGCSFENPGYTDTQRSFPYRTCTCAHAQTRTLDLYMKISVRPGLPAYLWELCLAQQYAYAWLGMSAAYDVFSCSRCLQHSIQSRFLLFRCLSSRSPSPALSVYSRRRCIKSLSSCVSVSVHPCRIASGNEIT